MGRKRWLRIQLPLFPSRLLRDHLAKIEMYNYQIANLTTDGLGDKNGKKQK